MTLAIFQLKQFCFDNDKILRLQRLNVCNLTHEVVHGLGVDEIHLGTKRLMKLTRHSLCDVESYYEFLIRRGYAALSFTFWTTA
jgi:hypothetical protein